MPSQVPARSGRPRIGNRLREILDERFITQDELAAALDVHVQNVSRWVRNETGPQKRNLRELAEHLGVDPRSLINQDHDEEVAA